MASDQAAVLTVGEVMIAQPKTHPGDALVRDIRRAFENPSVRTVLLADTGVFRGAIERTALPDDAPADAPALAYAETEPPTAVTAMPVAEAIELLERSAEPRLIVLDEDGRTLRGLLCFNRGSREFCVS